jgi:PBP1b-binding outer membrane lipoprotein LpoB
MKKLSAVSFIALLVLFAAGCGKSVKRVEVEEQIDLSGKWNDTDSRLVSE